MNEHPYKPPKRGIGAFNCPYCHAYSNQIWGQAYSFAGQKKGFEEVKSVSFAQCAHCREISIWKNENLIYPASTLVPQPNSDLPEHILTDYEEASRIVSNSPRGAAALLRLCIQKLCKHLGEKGSNINDDIASLVRNGLSPSIQKSLDFVRVIGNECVHPGKIDLRDDPDVAITLFKLVNIIAESMITQPKMIESLYEDLPQEKLDQIKRRDSK